jgi:hypothetical protein
MDLKDKFAAKMITCEKQISYFIGDSACKLLPTENRTF